ncbi:galactokinase [Rheinheimera texasensis]|uniref:galactokinase n=1 Tax=Rheinheimera texasensis TaxID=306205 RepID=UPI0032B1F4C1
MSQAFITTFQQIYAAKPDGLASAPGRVNLIGEFTDYNLGYVFPAALNFRTQVLFRARSDQQIVVHSQNYPGESDSFSLRAPIEPGPSQWGNYIRAMAYVLQQAGFTLCGADLLIDSDVPQGAGLSSSAALEVAIGGALNQLADLALTPAQIALFGQQAENQFMNCQCGIMDQMISAQASAGHALLLDCKTLATQAVPIPADLALVIVNSNYPRKLVDSEYNGRRQDCEQAAAIMKVATLRDATMDLLLQHKTAMTAQQFKRAHHVISENARVLATVDALQNSDMAQLRQLMRASHQSLRDDFAVTVPATDGLVEICQAALGTKGAVRMTGGGFGGAIICLCAEQDVALVEQAVAAHYQARFGLTADVYVCQAGTGLSVQLL